MKTSWAQLIVTAALAAAGWLYANAHTDARDYLQRITALEAKVSDMQEMMKSLDTKLDTLLERGR